MGSSAEYPSSREGTRQSCLFNRSRFAMVVSRDERARQIMICGHYFRLQRHHRHALCSDGEFPSQHPRSNSVRHEGPDARSLSDIAVRDEAKEMRPDARPQARKNRTRIRWITLKIFSGRERRRWSWIVRRSRTVNVGQAPNHHPSYSPEQPTEVDLVLQNVKGVRPESIEPLVSDNRPAEPSGHVPRR